MNPPAASKVSTKPGQAQTPVSRLLMLARSATQRGVKFIRWLRQSLRDRLAEALAVVRLKALYARL